MNEEQLHEALLDELEQTLHMDDLVCLYEGSWFLSNKGLSIEELEGFCQRAYRALCARHPDLTLVWVTWPHVTPEAATPAEPETDLDFHLDPHGPVDKPLLALARRNDG